MNRKHLFILITLWSLSIMCLMVIVAKKAQAQSACAAHDEFAALLANKFGEQKIGFGIAANALVEIYVSHKGTFTMLITEPNGPSCIFAAGKDWESSHEILGDKT